jgi:hypothetical protein
MEGERERERERGSGGEEGSLRKGEMSAPPVPGWRGLPYRAWKA